MLLSVYLFPKYTDNFFHYFFWVAFLLALNRWCLKEVAMHPLVLLLIAFIGYTSISSLWAHDSGKYGFESLKDGAYVLVALTVVVTAIRSFGIDRMQNWLMSASIAAACAVVLATFAFEQDALREALYGGSRLTHRAVLGMADNPIHSGFFAALAAMFAVHRYRKAESRRWACIYFFVVVLLCAFVVLTKSRGALLFLIATIGLLFCCTSPINRRRDIAFLLTGLLTAVFIALTNADLILARFKGDSIRLEILRAYGADFINAPIFGVGWSEDMGTVVPSGYTFSKPHNTFFHVLMVGGVFGASLFFFFTIYPIWHTMAHGSDNAKVAALWLVFGCMYMAVDGRYPIRPPSFQWMYYWIPIFMLIGSTIHSRQSQYASA